MREREVYAIERLTEAGERHQPREFFREKVYGSWQFSEADPKKLKTYATPTEAFEVLYDMEATWQRLARVVRLQVEQSPVER